MNDIKCSCKRKNCGKILRFWKDDNMENDEIEIGVSNENGVFGLNSTIVVKIKELRNKSESRGSEKNEN